MFPGPAAPGIARAAAERRLDLLVTGTHGRRGFRHLVLGSVAERLVHLAPCAVLVVRDVILAVAIAALVVMAAPDREPWWKRPTRRL